MSELTNYLNLFWSVVPCRYLSVVRGWWISWTSTAPRRSGAFVLEILERDSFDKRLLKGMKSTGQMFATAAGITPVSSAVTAPGAGSPDHSAHTHHHHGSTSDSVQSNPDRHGKTLKLAPNGEILRIGDVFRLRSVKYPEFEFGVTNVRLQDDFFYMGLAKVNNQLKPNLDIFADTKLICILFVD